MHVAQSSGKAMAHLTEIRVDGRGGQGNVVAAYILAEAGFEAGRFVQAFPTFGPERRGAPVAAFVRVSDQPIRRRCQISEPHYAIVQDPSLLHIPATAREVRAGGAVLVNSPRPVEGLALAAGVRLVTVAANALAIRILGEPIPNTALLAAFLSLTDLVPLGALEAVLARRFSGDRLERNLRLMREASACVPAGAWREASGAARN
jgi:pyruvate ferredoxin oxidoreductase gamma subunit